MTTHDVLVKTKAYLLQHGWQQNGYGMHGGPRCLVGAGLSVCGFRLDSDKTVEIDATPNRPPELVAAMTHITPVAPVWNDKPGRTFEEVIAALDEAIIVTAPPVTVQPLHSEPVLA